MQRTTLFLASFLLLAAATGAAAQQIRFTTGNDIFGSGDTLDDLYTFAVALDIEGESFDTSLRENAFTDRRGGTRFDETQFNLGFDLLPRSAPRKGGAAASPAPAAPWSAYLEAGAVRVGRGIFGETVQNDVHRAIGSEVIELPYEPTSLHGRLALSAARLAALGATVSAGPRFEGEWISALRAHAMVGAELVWTPRAAVQVAALVGGRWSDASFAPLEPYVKDFAPVVRVGATFLGRIFLAWSKNDYGDGRSHLSLGYSFTSFRLGEAGPVRR